MDSLGRPLGHHGDERGGLVEQEPREYIADILREIGYDVSYGDDELLRQAKFPPVELRCVGWFRDGIEAERRQVFEILLLHGKCDRCSRPRPWERSLAECTEQQFVPECEAVLDALDSSPYCQIVSSAVPLIGVVEQELTPVPSGLSGLRVRVVCTEPSHTRVERGRPFDPYEHEHDVRHLHGDD